jgi:hypothetical protein
MPRLEIARKRLAEADATVAALRDISHRLVKPTVAHSSSIAPRCYRPLQGMSVDHTPSENA